MESDQVRMFQVSREEPMHNSDQVVLRALLGDPRRYKPQVEHPPPTTIEAQKTAQATMYTLETKHRPIPEKVLPKSKEPQVYYIEPKQAGPTPEDDIPAKQEEEVPVVFLEPKIISEPVFYSVVSARTQPVHDHQPIITEPEISQPMFFTITGQSHQPIIDKTETRIIQKSPLLHSLIGYPVIHEVPAQEPIETVPVIEVTEQNPPNLYFIVGCPALTINLAEIIPVAPVQPEKITPVRSVPILHNIVGEAHVPKNIPREKRPPLAPLKPEVNDVSIYAVIGDPNLPRAISPPPKAKPLQPLKQKPPLPILHAAVGQANSPPKENILMSNTKPKHPEPTIPKSDTVFIPFVERERVRRPKNLRTAPSNPSYGLIRHKPLNIARYSPINLPDYISPYSYHPSRGYKEPTVHPKMLPLLRSNKSERRLRQAFDSPKDREERKYRYDPWTYHSLERYHENKRHHSRLWDFEVNSQTDPDDNADEPVPHKRKQGYRKSRPRTPWEPVW